MPLDPRLEVVRAALPKDIDRSLPPAERRRLVQERHARNVGRFIDHGARMAAERDLLVSTPAGEVPVRVYRPRDGLLPGLIHIHGGGWWQGSIEESDDACRRRAAGGDCAVVSIGYRLAPEHPFPAGLDDCVAVSRWVVANADALGIDPARVVMSGASAGGNLATAVTIRCRDQGGPAFAGLLLEMPGMDLVALDSPSMREYGEGHGFTRGDIDEIIEFYLDGRDPADPLVSLVNADLHGLPPTLVTTMECDPFRDGAEVFADRAAAAGVAVTRRRFDGMAHGCAELDMIVPEIAGEYAALVYGFLRDTLHAEVVG